MKTARVSTDGFPDVKPKRKSEEVIDITHDVPVRVSATSHMWLRGNKMRVIIEYFAFHPDDLGGPEQTTTLIISMSPQEFETVAQHFNLMVDRLASVGTH